MKKVKTSTDASTAQPKPKKKEKELPPMPTISINGFVLNEKFSIAQVMESLFMCVKFEYSPMDVVKANLAGVLDIAEQYFADRRLASKGKDKTECSAMLRTIKTWTDHISDMDREWLIQNYWDFRMRNEKMGLLPGFGYIAMEKTEDGKRRTLKTFRINPEKVSLEKFAKMEG